MEEGGAHSAGRAASLLYGCVAAQRDLRVSVVAGCGARTAQHTHTRTMRTLSPLLLTCAHLPRMHRARAQDGDGHLTAVEIATALKSRGVQASPEQVQEFIDGESRRHTAAAAAAAADIAAAATAAAEHTASKLQLQQSTLPAQPGRAPIPRPTALGAAARPHSHCTCLLPPAAPPAYTPPPPRTHTRTRTRTRAPKTPRLAAVDANKNGTVERSEFPDFIFSLASCELRSVASMD